VNSLTKARTGSRRRLHAGFVEFMTDLEEHIRLENEVLFPQFEPH
jgi:regulator of cell morphogenesis and NO signaling